MKSQFGNRPVLCRFINNCRDFKQTQKCKYLHDLCNKKDKCEFGEKCKYYHPQLAAKFANNRQNQNNYQSLLKKAPCKYGQNCRNKDTCKFSHDDTNVQRPIFPPKTAKQLPQCTFGSKCNKFALGQCRFKHSNMASVSGPAPRQDNINRISTTGTENLQQQNLQQTNFNAELQDFERNKLCRQFAIGQCKQGDSCQMTHQFGLDNNIKRVFFRNFPDEEPASSKILCTSFKINELRIFALARGRILGFYELDLNFSSLKNVSASELKIQDLIVSLTSTASEMNDKAKIILTTRNKKLHVYNPIEGIISSRNYNIPQKLTGAIQFSEQELLFISNEQTGLTIEKNNEIKTQIVEKINSSSPDRLANITTMKVFQLFGSTFSVFGTQQGNLTIINTNFESKWLHISDSPIKDICGAIYWQKPFLFAIVNTNQRKSEVISINMLDFTTQTVIEFEDTIATRICSNHNRLFMGVENIGVLVYFLSEFPKLKSRIQLIGSIQLLECDNDGNLTVISRDSQQRNSSLSIYRLRR